MTSTLTLPCASSTGMEAISAPFSHSYNRDDEGDAAVAQQQRACRTSMNCCFLLSTVATRTDASLVPDGDGACRMTSRSSMGKGVPDTHSPVSSFRRALCVKERPEFMFKSVNPVRNTTSTALEPSLPPRSHAEVTGIMPASRSCNSFASAGTAAPTGFGAAGAEVAASVNRTGRDAVYAQQAEAVASKEAAPAEPRQQRAHGSDSRIAPPNVKDYSMDITENGAVVTNAATNGYGG